MRLSFFSPQTGVGVKNVIKWVVLGLSQAIIKNPNIDLNFYIRHHWLLFTQQLPALEGSAAPNSCYNSVCAYLNGVTCAITDRPKTRLFSNREELAIHSSARDSDCFYKTTTFANAASSAIISVSNAHRAEFVDKRVREREDIIKLMAERLRDEHQVCQLLLRLCYVYHELYIFRLSHSEGVRASATGPYVSWSIEYHHAG